MRIKIPFTDRRVSINEPKSAAVDVATIQTADDSEEKLYDVLGGFLTFTKGALSNEKTISSKILQANKEWVYRNNDVIAQEVSKMDFELYSVGLKDGEIVFNVVEEHPLLDVLDRFNPHTTRSEGIYMTQSHKKLTGDAFWLLDKNGNTVENIFVLPPDKIELELADPTDATADMVREYVYRDNIDNKQILQRYSPEQIIHFKKPNPNNPFRGYGAVEAIADTIDADNLTNLVQRNFFDKGAITNFVLTTDAKITQEQLKRTRAEIRAMYSGARNAYTTMIFGNGLKPANIGFSNKDMQFLDVLEWYRDKIMIGFGNTKASLGVIDDVNRASYEGAYYGWLESTVKPDMSSIVNTLNEFLVPQFGENLLLGYKNPVPEDLTDEIETAVQLKNAGIIMINEARQKVGYDPIQGGDVFAPAGAVTVPGQEDEEPQTTNNPNQDEEDEKNQKRIYRKGDKRMRIKNIPDALKSIELDSLLRRRGIYFERRVNREMKDAVKPMIRQMLKSKQKQTGDPIVHGDFTNEQILKYYDKQIHVVDIMEGQFRERVLKLLTIVEEQTLENFDNEVKTIRSLKKFGVKKQLFDESSLLVQAKIDLLPILLQEVTIAGQEALRLINSDDTYIPFKIQDSIRAMVDKFASSMLETDKNLLTQIIADAIEEGDSIPEIRAKIQSKFSKYKETQATRIARTEVLRASNMAAEDAFIQSGVVEAKEWLVAPGADEMCMKYAGKIVKLNRNFYTPDESGFQDGNPPIHVSCRCILVPIVEGTKGFTPMPVFERQIMLKKIEELEQKADKRKKAFKEIKAKYTEKEEEVSDLEAYSRALEKYVGVDEEE